MPDSDNNPRPPTSPLATNDAQSTENRMRRALGLGGPGTKVTQQRADQARPRHRFVQDGGVPVVVLNSRSDNDPTTPLKARISELDAAMESERAAHGATRRTLQEVQASAQALQTRLAHAEFAHGEALGAERRARKEAEDSLTAAAQPLPAPVTVAASPKAVVPKAPKAPRVPRVARVKEPKPVKWWTPGFREKSR